MGTQLPARLRASRVRHAAIAVLALALGAAFAGPLAAQSNSDFGPEWKKTLELAKKEGRVMVGLGSSSLRETRPIWKIFEDKFGIKTVVSGGSGRKVAQRMLAERRAGKVQLDIVGLGTASVMNFLAPNDIVTDIETLLFVPEVVDNSKWWGGKRWYADPDGKYLLMYTLEPGDAGIGINTKLVKESDINSYWDVFHPRYNGLRVSGTMSISQGANSLVDMMALVGPEWLERWVKSKPIYVADTDIGINYLIEGRAGLGMFLSGELQQLDKLAKEGAPVKRITKAMKEGQAAGRGNCCFSAVKNPPHPNAQKILFNWLYSREGQMAIQKANPRSNSPRIDLPKDELAADVRRTPGAKYILTSQRRDATDLLKKAQEAIEKAKAEVK
jgi:ABC-type Fe3+ transport system substrate-binding protein